MDKDNKYYEIIENLVKQHKKYPEYQAILDDIIDDVFAHSEVIINSITNESVIEAYLQKVIATSMITVPKKLGVRKYVRQVIAKPTAPEQSINEQAEQSFEPEKVEDIQEIKVNTELVDKMINLAETPKEDSVELTETAPISIEDLDDSLEKDVDIDLAFADKEEELTEELKNQPEYDAAEPENEAVFTEGDEETAAEEMAQQDDIVRDEEEQDSAVYSEETVFPDEEKVSFEDNLAESEPSLLFDNDVQDDIVETEEKITIGAEENILETVENTDSSTVSIDVMQPQEEDALEIADASDDFQEQISDIVETDSFETLDVDESDSYYEKDLQEVNAESVETADNLSEAQDMDITNFSASDESLDEVADSEDLLFFGADDELKIENGSEDLLEEVADSEKTENPSCSVIDYSVFAPSEDENLDSDFDEEELSQEIQKLDSKYSTLKIIQVFNLRYKQNYTISQIAQELNVDAANVYSALSKISDLV